LAPLAHRGLQLFDSRKVEKYLESLERQISYHKILEKLEILHASVQNGTWTLDHNTQYKRLDNLLSESMLYTEKALTKALSKRYEWSPVLKQSIHALRFWELSRKQSIGLKLPNTTLQKEAEKDVLDLSTLPSPLTCMSIMKYRTQANKNLNECQSNHSTLRENHLIAIAIAMVESRGSTCTEINIQKEVKQLKLRESRRKMFDKLEQH
jgi:hypothetical protein